KNVDETLREAGEFIRQGFRILKVKLGKDLGEDMERIIKLREKFGNKVVIRIDANQGYTVAETLEFYSKTRDLDVELIEQPLPAKAVNEMKSMPDEVRRKIAADESLITAKDVVRLVKPPFAACIFNIILMICGGVSHALKIADIALHE